MSAKPRFKKGDTVWWVLWWSGEVISGVVKKVYPRRKEYSIYCEKLGGQTVLFEEAFAAEDEAHEANH